MKVTFSSPVATAELSKFAGILSVTLSQHHLDYLLNTISLIRDSLLWSASRVMLKILQARLQQYVNRELPDVQAGFRKGREPEIKLPTSSGS